MSISLKCTFAVFQKRAKVIIFAHRCKTGAGIVLAAKAVLHSLSEGLGLRHSLSEGLCSQTGSLRSRRLLRIPSPLAAGALQSIQEAAAPPSPRDWASGIPSPRDCARKRARCALAVCCAFPPRLRRGDAKQKEIRVQASLTRISFCFAEREGFEPPERCRSTVFKTAVIDHSTTSPVPCRGKGVQI